MSDKLISVNNLLKHTVLAGEIRNPYMEVVPAYFAREALEKQMPKKLLPEQRYYGIGKCSRCGVVFTDDTTKYCGNCGQAIDWEEGESDA